MGDVHVIPLNDLKEHTLGYRCKCEPMEARDGGQTVWIHYSFDGREFWDDLETGSARLPVIDRCGEVRDS